MFVYQLVQKDVFPLVDYGNTQLILKIWILFHQNLVIYRELLKITKSSEATEYAQNRDRIWTQRVNIHVPLSFLTNFLRSMHLFWLLFKLCSLFQGGKTLNFPPLIGDHNLSRLQLLIGV